jgi:hypothetical protein
MRERPGQSKAGQDPQRSRRGNFWKRIHRAWYTTYRLPLHEWSDRPLAQSKSFSPIQLISTRVDVLLQHLLETVEHPLANPVVSAGRVLRRDAACTVAAPSHTPLVGAALLRPGGGRRTASTSELLQQAFVVDVEAERLSCPVEIGAIDEQRNLVGGRWHLDAASLKQIDGQGPPI